MESMRTKRTGLLENSMIWFGAAVGLGEILTGTYLAPLGMQKGIAAIILGHIIGCALFFFAGYIGGTERKSSMETSKMSFGNLGGKWFAFLNVLQLIGWTAIMIYNGALAAAGATGGHMKLWCIVIGALIVLWIAIGITNLGKTNLVAISALFIVTVILCVVMVKSAGPAGDFDPGALSFGAAVELSATMPISWLPLISDYTREAREPKKATVVSTVTYGLGSCWMYVIGMGAAIYMGEGDIAQIMLKAGLGAIGLIIVVLSTVTTTFLDAYSAGVSSKTIRTKSKVKFFGIAVAIIGTIAAAVYPMANIENFLYLIGAVFAPMIAIMITDFFILKRSYDAKRFDAINLAIWLIGFLLYELVINKLDFVLGYTIIDIALVMIMCVAAYPIRKALK